ncbi:MAG: VWA domain-containing protein [Verrucomicrobia bacterium]|nr:VWA domain-containing protein [Verrucomicrobiota bacterium]
MTFAYPYVLLLLALLPVLAWLKGRHGKEPAFLYSSTFLVRSFAGLRRSTAGRILPKLRWFVLAFLIVALARPQILDKHVPLKASGVDIIIAIDCSGTMASEDFEIGGRRANRIEVAKNVIRDFIEQRRADRIGLVAFAGKAYVACPLTLDHEFLVNNLNRLSLDVITEDGTAIGSAITAALNRLRESDSKSRIVILMTDGQNNTGNVPPLTAAEAAAALRTKVYTIGVGTRGVAPYPRKNAFGRIVYVPVEVDIDEKTLKKIAARTSANYYRADNTRRLQSIYNEIDSLEKTEFDLDKFRRRTDVFQWAALPALVLLLLEIILANTIWRKLP